MKLNTDFIEKLRNSGLRPTKQRLKICEILFNTEKTFHFTINDLSKTISEKLSEKISLATVYNTVHAFQKKGYLKEISINNNKCYFDTNTSAHHHFYDEDTSELIDWLKLLMADELSESLLQERDPTKAIPPLYGALIKNEQDVQLLQRLAFMARRKG